MSLEPFYKLKIPGTIILSLTCSLLLFVWTYLEKLLLLTTKQELSTLYLLQLALSVILVIMALLAFIGCLLFLRHKEQIINTEPTLIHGIYFDYAFNPLCPSCKTPLQIESLPIEQQIINLKKPKLICPNGHYNRIPTDDRGTELHIAILRSTLIKEYFNIKDDEK